MQFYPTYYNKFIKFTLLSLFYYFYFIVLFYHFYTIILSALLSLSTYYKIKNGYKVCKSNTS